VTVKRISILNHPVFDPEGLEVSSEAPITLVIGKNNSGKSRFLEVLEFLSNTPFKDIPWDLTWTGHLDERELKTVFLESTSQGQLGGNHWHAHGAHFIGKSIEWRTTPREPGVNPNSVVLPEDLKTNTDRVDAARRSHLTNALARQEAPYYGMTFCVLSAERDISPEVESPQLTLNRSGKGATNIIRRHLVSSSEAYPEDLIRVTLLDGLNKIFGSDGNFTSIGIKLHDDTEPKNHWEIHLYEERKGAIKLSDSGSGLKTVILALLNLHVMPLIAKVSPEKLVFAFEELENNLHPSLLRRLLGYIEDYVEATGCRLVLTTHSATTLDFFGRKDDSALIRISHDGKHAHASRVRAHFEKLAVINELGAKPSDLLQANGIIWVEGPSDRIYVNQLIQEYSQGAFEEGIHYQCAFYGGALLSRVAFSSPENEMGEYANLLRLNNHVAFVGDGDRTAEEGPDSELKERVARVIEQFSMVPGAKIWVTDRKEIENYLTAEALQKAFQVEDELPAPEAHERFFPSQAESKRGDSYLEKYLSRRSYDKNEIALKAAPHLTVEKMAAYPDLDFFFRELIEAISVWNS
tara:strand:- start:7183 stop:8919 length:1737 start_codon:yes stop_codon:yes gene_type:complete